MRWRHQGRRYLRVSSDRLPLALRRKHARLPVKTRHLHPLWAAQDTKPYAQIRDRVSVGVLIEARRQHGVTFSANDLYRRDAWAELFHELLDAARRTELVGRIPRRQEWH